MICHPERSGCFAKPSGNGVERPLLSESLPGIGVLRPSRRDYAAPSLSMTRLFESREEQFRVTESTFADCRR
jgi:hypothetical protein